MIQLIATPMHRTRRLPGSMLPRPIRAVCVDDLQPSRPHAHSVDEVERCFRTHGGLANGDELAGALRRHLEQPVSCIARLIVSRRIVVLERGPLTWVPLFQFADARLTVRPPVSQVIAELVDVFDDEELALWFTTPNTWLDGRRPVVVIGAQPDAVHAAARADRFVAAGS